MRARAAAAVAALAVLGWTSVSSAYCRTTTCVENCRRDAQGCIIDGAPLYWPGACVSFSGQEDGSPLSGLTFADGQSVMQASFQTWLSSSCGGQPASIEVIEKSPVECSVAEYNSQGPNANIITFVDGTWPYDGPNATLALTTITFNVESGEIFDADIEVNSANNAITTGDVDVSADLQSILTHEVGHFFGLSHTPVREATMFRSYAPGDTSLRDLHPDDIAGFCAIYPPGRQASACNNGTPRHGFSTKCGGAEEESGCCTVAPGRQSSGSRSTSVALVGLALAAALWTRRRRRACRRSER